jgi:gluconokinase
MQALGMAEGVERAAELVHVESVSGPDAAAAEAYAALLPVFAGLYDALAPSFAELRRLGPSLPREPQRPTD